MNKFAHLVKTAEVRGVMAYLVDSEMVKVASEEDFDALVNAVSESVEGEYDLNTVLSKTAELLEGEGGEKTAEDDELPATEEDVYQTLGILTMAKMAGEITEEDFEKKASVAGKAGAKVRDLKDILTGARIKDARSGVKDAKAFKAGRPSETANTALKDARKELAKETAKTLGTYGGVGTTGVLGTKKLRNKNK